jgi:hypothetical protein
MIITHFQKLLNPGIILSLLTLLSLIYLPRPTAAAGNATITVSPTTGNYAVGDTFSVNVVIDGSQESFNAAKASVTVSSNLAVQSLTLGNCKFSFVETPGVANPSFTGVILGGSAKKCTVYTLTLKAVSTGTSSISLKNGSIKASKNSNEIFSTFTEASFRLSGSALSNVTVTPSSITSTGNSSARAGTYTVNLTIVNNYNKPIPQAIVTVNNGTKLIAGMNGTLKIPNLPEGVLSLKVTDKNGGKVAEQIVNVTGDQKTLVLGITQQSSSETFPWIQLTAILLIGGGIIAFVLMRNKLFKQKDK